MKKIQSKEQGQILVLLILVFIGIIAFAALAMDGGMIFSDRRYSQNAADAASMTGATKAGEYFNNYVSGTGEPILNSNFTCDGEYIPLAKNTALDESVASAVQNNFSIAKDDTSAESYVEVTCVDNGSDAPPYDKYLAVKVQITTQTTSNFAHLFYPGPLKGTVEAVTKLYPGFNAGLGQGLLSTCEKVADKDLEKYGITASGDKTDVVLKGDSSAFSNCSLISNNGIVTSESGSISYNKIVDDAENFTPEPTKVDYQFEPFPSSAIVNQSMCGPDRGTINVGKNQEPFLPGTYDKITQNGYVLTLTPGLYCMKGDFTMNKGAILGDGVTFYMINGNFTIGGNAGVYKNDDGSLTYTSLRGTYDPNERDNLTYWGYLIVMDDMNPSKYNITITGNSGTEFSGTIYSPLHDVNLNGTADTYSTIPEDEQEVLFSTQIIGNTIKISGNPTIEIEYDDSNAPYFEPSLDLHK